MKLTNIYKRDYSEGFKHRTDIPKHALTLPWGNGGVKCFAFFGLDKKGKEQPVQATLVPADSLFPVSKYNYKVKFLN